MSTLWTPRRRKLVERFVSEAIVRLHLRDWEILIDFEYPAMEGTIATISRIKHQKRAILQFNAENFLSDSPEQQRQTLAHELIHCHLFDVHEAAEIATEAVSGAGHRSSLESMISSRVEIATDSLANAFAALLSDLPVPATDAPLRDTECSTIQELRLLPVPPVLIAAKNKRRRT